jgi:hypothetical protein
MLVPAVADDGAGKPVTVRSGPMWINAVVLRVLLVSTLSATTPFTSATRSRSKARYCSWWNDDLGRRRIGGRRSKGAYDPAAREMDPSSCTCVEREIEACDGLRNRHGSLILDGVGDRNWTAGPPVAGADIADTTRSPPILIVAVLLRSLFVSVVSTTTLFQSALPIT